MSFQVMRKTMNIYIYVSNSFPFLDSDSGSGTDYTSLQMFLAAVGLHDWTPKFVLGRNYLKLLMNGEKIWRSRM